MFENDPCTFTIRCFANKWKPHVLWELRSGEPIRFGTLLKRMPISERVLSQTLKELIADSLVDREVFPDVPPRVEYCITEIGKTAIPIIESMYNWGRARMLATGHPLDEVGEMRHGYLPLDQDKTNNPSKYC